MTVCLGINVILVITEVIQVTFLYFIHTLSPFVFEQHMIFQIWHEVYCVLTNVLSNGGDWPSEHPNEPLAIHPYVKYHDK